jgi:hypothetical protein
MIEHTLGNTTIFLSLYRKNVVSTTPLCDALKALIFALKDSAEAFMALLMKKFVVFVNGCSNRVERLKFKFGNLIVPFFLPPHRYGVHPVLLFPREKRFEVILLYFPILLSNKKL